MILFKNNLMVLDYDPSTDILMVEWPNVEAYQLSLVRDTLRTLVDYIKNYDVSYLLIDASNTSLNSELVDLPQYKEIIMEFAYSLANTRLKKSARISALDKNREAKTQKISNEVKQETHLQIQNKDFANRTEATAWLLS